MPVEVIHAAGMPLVVLEREYLPGSVGQLRTRTQTLLETGLLGMLREELGKIGVPMFAFDEDGFDPRVSPPEAFHPKIMEFVDMCIAQKQRG